MAHNRLRRTMLAALGSTVLAGFSTEAGAFTSTSLGSFTGATITRNDAAPFKSWSDYGTNENYGWVHTADWFRIQVGSASDIAGGATFDVKFDLSPRGSTQPMTAGGFSIWTSGTAPLIDGTGFHAYNQVRGPNDGGITTNNKLGSPGNIVQGHDGWVGYAQNGLSFTNGDGDVVTNGGAWNTGSPYLTGGSASAGSSATLNLFGLKAGYYLIGLGGVCPDDSPSCIGTLPGSREYTFTVSAVPLPAAVWLFGSALAAMGVIGRRRETTAALTS